MQVSPSAMILVICDYANYITHINQVEKANIKSDNLTLLETKQLKDVVLGRNQSNN